MRKFTIFFSLICIGLISYGQSEEENIIKATRAKIEAFINRDLEGWKENTRIVTLPESYKPNEHSAESDLNAVGYNLLGVNKVKEAIEVFKLNVKFFPNSWNVYDSLGEAYAAAGNKKEAIENYEKSIQLNPKNDSGRETLAKLKQK